MQRKSSNRRASPEDLPTLMSKRAAAASRLDEITGGKTITKSTVPERTDSHWDYLLKEMKWLSEDFEQERDRHLKSRRKVGKMVLTYFRQQGTKEERQAREQQLALRKIASKVSSSYICSRMTMSVAQGGFLCHASLLGFQVARDVRTFWAKINRVVGFKQKVSDMVWVLPRRTVRALCLSLSRHRRIVKLCT